MNSRAKLVGGMAGFLQEHDAVHGLSHVLQLVPLQSVRLSDLDQAHEAPHCVAQHHRLRLVRRPRRSKQRLDRRLVGAIEDSIRCSQVPIAARHGR